MSSNTHFILLSDPPWPGPVAYRISGPDQVLGLGRSLDRDLGEFEFELRLDSKAPEQNDIPPLDWFDPVDGQLLLSRRLIELIRSLGVSNIELYPAKVHYLARNQWLDYSVVNIIGITSVLNTSAAGDGILPGFEIGAQSIKLDMEKCRGVDFARIEEIPSLIVISSRIAKGLRDLDLTGFKIIADYEWQTGMF